MLSLIEDIIILWARTYFVNHKIAQSNAIPAQSTFFTAQFTLKIPHNFNFPRTLSEED